MRERIVPFTHAATIIGDIQECNKLVTVLAHRLARRGQVLARHTAWYAQPRPTFSDALAAGRLEHWRQPTFHMSKNNKDIAKLPNAIFKRFAQALCHAS